MYVCGNDAQRTFRSYRFESKRERVHIAHIFPFRCSCNFGNTYAGDWREQVRRKRGREREMGIARHTVAMVCSTCSKHLIGKEEICVSLIFFSIFYSDVFYSLLRRDILLSFCAFHLCTQYLSIADIHTHRHTWKTLKKNEERKQMLLCHIYRQTTHI